MTAAGRRAWASELREWLVSEYAEDNARLQELTGLDLRAHGYALPLSGSGTAAPEKPLARVSPSPS